MEFVIGLLYIVALVCLVVNLFRFRGVLGLVGSALYLLLNCLAGNVLFIVVWAVITLMYAHLVVTQQHNKESK